MISTLLKRGLINSRLFGELSRYEIDSKKAFIAFLNEIPANYLGFITTREKRKRVAEHLKILYKAKPTDSEIDVVLRRLVNLAIAATHTREEIEDRARRGQFRVENWKRVGRCEVCGFQFLDAGSATVDHILPLSLGGDDAEINWQLLCRLCNDQKSHHFGCGDLRRIDILTNVHYFNLSAKEQLSTLSAPHLPLRYQLFERSERKCICGTRSSLTKLYLSASDTTCILNADNLQVLCERCISKKKTGNINIP